MAGFFAFEVFDVVIKVFVSWECYGLAALGYCASVDYKVRSFRYECHGGDDSEGKYVEFAHLDGGYSFVEV